MAVSFRRVHWRGTQAAICAVPALLCATAAAAQREDRIYDRLTVSDMHEVLVLNGLAVTTQPLDGENVVADNRIAVDDEFARWYVYFYNCEGDAGCADMEFRAAWSGADPTLEAMNDWNSRYRFTRAWRSDQGFAVLSMDVNADGGVTAGSIGSMLPLWRRAVARFASTLAEDNEG